MGHRWAQMVPGGGSRPQEPPGAEPDPGWELVSLLPGKPQPIHSFPKFWLSSWQQQQELVQEQGPGLTDSSSGPNPALWHPWLHQTTPWCPDGKTRHQRGL